MPRWNSPSWNPFSVSSSWLLSVFISVVCFFSQSGLNLHKLAQSVPHAKEHRIATGWRRDRLIALFEKQTTKGKLLVGLYNFFEEKWSTKESLGWGFVHMTWLRRKDHLSWLTISSIVHRYVKFQVVFKRSHFEFFIDVVLLFLFIKILRNAMENRTKIIFMVR